MIIPVVQEAEWMSLLCDLPCWQPPEKPTVVISPHPDDETLGSGGLIARLRSKGTYFFWTWHRGDKKTLDGQQLVSLPLAPEEIRAKQDALRCHRSQLQRAGGFPILPEYLLEPVRRSFEVFLPA
jgi:LmbE family N-acetylglucosaminyl deacetylase